MTLGMLLLRYVSMRDSCLLGSMDSIKDDSAEEENDPYQRRNCSQKIHSYGNIGGRISNNQGKTSVKWYEENKKTDNAL